ncbi:DUF3592 domain-containing protein, partial [Kitasatospora sp. LaBMicrA B282]|uniref:DUF3592 domain-containing protein n=1 Tax=Kitasatospora sp. LaBMicrA B282 TaxID=3420949 RepID=UPI003D0A725C
MLLRSGAAARTALRRLGPLGGLVFLVVGVAVCGLGFRMQADHSPYPDGLRATGTVVGVLDRGSPDGSGDTWSARYRFTTAAGRQVTFTEPDARFSRPRPGSTAELSYRAGDPQHARVIGGGSAWSQWLLYAMGAAFLLVGLDAVGGRRLRHRWARPADRRSGSRAGTPAAAVRRGPRPATGRLDHGEGTPPHPNHFCRPAAALDAPH